MANETKPKLFSYYDDQYDYNTFSRAANTGFADYISQYDYNDQDRQYIWDAYSNLLSGIGDGSIIFNNGRLRDLKGRYSNNYYYDSEGKKQKSKGDNRDYYGVAANYLLGVMSNQKKYEAPTEEKPIWDDVTRQSDLSWLIFKTNNPTDAQLKYFIDNDALTNGTRGTSERAKIVADALSEYYTEENLLNKGASKEDATKYSQWAQEAIKRLSNGKIDAGDTWVLSGLLPGYDLDALFRSQEQTPEQTPEQTQHNNLEETKRKFVQTWQENYASPEGAKKEFNLNFKQYQSPSENLVMEWMAYLEKLNDDQLKDLLQMGLIEPKVNFSTITVSDSITPPKAPIPTPMVLHTIIQELGNTGHGITDQEGNITLTDFFDLDNRAGYVYNPNTKILQRVPFSESGYWRKKIFEKETGLRPRQDSIDWIDDLFVKYQKKGGVIKAQNGIKYENYYKNPEDAITYTSDLAGTRYKNVLGEDNKWTTQQRQNPSTNNNNPNDLLYDPELGNPEERSFWDDWIKYLTSNRDLAKRWAEGYMSLQQDQKIKNEIQRQWNDDNGFNFEKFKQNITRDRVTKQLWNDKINGIGHDFYIGDVYRIKGEDEQPDRYYKGIVEGYSRTGGPTMSDNGLYRIHDLVKAEQPGPTLPEIREPKVSVSVDIGRNPSDVNPTTGKSKENTNFDWTGVLGNLSTDLLGIGRLFGSLRTNNRVHDTLMDSLNPALKDTYELYSPITGAFNEMQFRNRQAADLRRQVARPFTSDASLQLAGLLEANRQARDLEYQGFLADDKEIKRTQEAALARQEDNIKRRSDVANFNRASINQTNRERAELDAARLRNNWQSVDNYLSGVESRLRSRLQQREDREYQTGQMLAQNDYQTAIQEYNKKYKRDNPDATTESMLADPVYVRHVQDLKRRYQYNLYELLSNRTYRPNFNTPPSYQSIIYSKQGGQLLPKTVNLINKVIRNENNS